MQKFFTFDRLPKFGALFNQKNPENVSIHQEVYENPLYTWFSTKFYIFCAQVHENIQLYLSDFNS